MTPPLTPQPSNFAFLGMAFPNLLHDAREAEQTALSSPRTAAMLSRFVMESTLNYIVDTENIKLGPRANVNDKLQSYEVRKIIPHQILEKFDIIRRLGNKATHDSRGVTTDKSTRAIAHLYDITAWTALNYASHKVKTQHIRPFDPTIVDNAPKRKAANSTEVAQLRKKLAESNQLAQVELEEKDKQLLQQQEEHAREKALFAKRQAQHQAEAAKTAEEHAEVLAQKEQANEALQRELEQLRRQLAAAQKAPQPVALQQPALDEAETRKDIIDPMLAEAGFSTAQGNLIEEYPVTMADGSQGRIDYALVGPDAKIIAVVEAKHTAKDPQVGRQQAQLYADAVENAQGLRPIMFYTNGHEVFLWDDATNLPEGAEGFPPRRVEGYATSSQLQKMILRRANRRALAEIPIDAEIAGRDYQQKMIRSVTEKFTRGHRRALLVMATTKLMQQSGWAGNILFLADRTALVNQAEKAFKENLPNTAVINLLKDRGGTGQVYLSTYQSMMGMIDADAKDGARFNPYHFDMIIIDEAHRTVYHRYRRIFEYFDSYLLGLTATPRNGIDHNTFALFGEEDGQPTGVYTLQEAVDDGYLVDFKVLGVDTVFLRRGINYQDLSEEEQLAWDAAEWGTEEDGTAMAPPSEVDPAAINAKLYNIDTIRKVLATLHRSGLKVSGADQLGKTIIFARNQQHARLILEVWDEMYPEGSGHKAAVITHAEHDPQALINRFSDPSSGLDVAISVDMLDTGIDVPEVLNLVFFKPVYSPTKFWQMIGRGTRLRPNLFGPDMHKLHFLVIDFCGNVESFSDPEEVYSEGSRQKSLSERLFRRRVQLASCTDNAALSTDLRDYLHEQVVGVPQNSILVAPEDKAALERYRSRDAWNTLQRADIEEIEDHLSHLPLPSMDEGEAAKRFDYLILGLQLALTNPESVSSDQWEEMQQRVITSAQKLLANTNVPIIKAQAEHLEDFANSTWWEDVRIEELERLRRTMRELVHLIPKQEQNVLVTDFVDEVTGVTEIPVNLRSADVAIDLDLVESKLEAVLSTKLDSIAMQKLRSAKDLTSVDIQFLEQTVADAGVENLDKLQQRLGTDSIPMFIRRIVGLDKAAMTEEFADLLNGSTLSSVQIAFIRLIVDLLAHNGSLTVQEFFEPPLSDYGTVTDIFQGNNAIILDLKSRLEKIEGTAGA